MGMAVDAAEACSTLHRLPGKSRSNQTMEALAAVLMAVTDPEGCRTCPKEMQNMVSHRWRGTPTPGKRENLKNPMIQATTAAAHNCVDKMNAVAADNWAKVVCKQCKWAGEMLKPMSLFNT